jgi:F-type H+-transporting ATPase subunit delta
MAGVSSESLATGLAELEAKLPTASLQLAKELFGILGWWTARLACAAP